MKKFENYLIISDLDGTFLGDNATLVPKNIEAIQYFQQNGGIFTIATGRDKAVLEFIFPNANEFIFGPAILCNGVYLYDFQKREMNHELVIDQDKTISLIRFLENKFPHIGYRISTANYLLTDHCTDDLQRKMARFSSILKVDDLENHRNVSWHKIVYSGSKEEIQSLADFCKKQTFEGFFCITSSETLLEFLPIGATKGQKVAKLRRDYPNRTFVCVGDYDNDVDMLLSADIAACPENANMAVKNICTTHLCSNQNGCIADLIYQLTPGIKE